MTKKISDLETITDLDDFYVVGSKNNQTVKYNLDTLDTKLDKENNSLGLNNITTFDATSNYYTGQLVYYNGEYYRFLSLYKPGYEKIWEKTNLFSELWGDTEILTVCVSFSDNALSVSGRQVAIIFADGSTTRTLVTDSNGKCSTAILKGKIYSVSVNDEDTYIVEKYENIKANVRNRNLNIIYTKNNQTCTLEVNIITSGSGGSISDFEGQSFKITKGTEIRTATVTNGKATFTGLQKNTNYTLNNTYLDSTGTYKRPEDKNITTSFDVNKVNVEYTKTNYGLFAVDNNDNEIELTQEFIDTLGSEDKDTYKAIHVNPETLAKNGSDYYVRCKDLTTDRTIVGKIWGTMNKTLPNVSTNTTTEYRGKLMTYYMIKDERTVSPISKSPAAEYVTTQEYTRGGGEVLKGYIGTRAQLEFILPSLYSANKILIYNFLTAIGYAPNYSSTILWSSSQYSANYAWHWNSGGYWYNGNKGGAYLVVPLFSFTSL